MYSLTIENPTGKKIKLTQNESNYQVLRVDGLTPPKARITTTALANMDGERFKDSRLEMRNLVFTIRIKGDVEKNRIALYDFFDVGQKCKIYYKNNSRNVYIEGYCESADDDLFASQQEMQVSVICDNPFWKNLAIVYSDISALTGSFEFPFSISAEGIEFSNYVENRKTEVVYTGDVESGFVITITALDDGVINPVIYNYQTQDFIKVNVTLNKSERLIINSNKGLKSVYKIVDGVKTNIIGLLDKDSTWLTLKKGVNIFTSSSDSNSVDLKIIFEHNSLYKGV